MKKKILIAGIGLLLLLAFISPYLLGKKAETVLNTQYQILQKSNIVAVENRVYERGWFSSKETWTVRIKPALFSNIQDYLPDNIKTVLEKPITVVNHISHTPFNTSFAAATVESELIYDVETEKVLKRFFGENKPLVLHNTIYLSGRGKLDFSIPAFDYEELSGIKLVWKGLTGQVEYAKDWQQYQQQYDVEAFQAQLADKGSVEMHNIRFAADTKESQTAIALGNSQISVGKVALSWEDGIEYQFKINELINLVSDLQIGAFINPTGTLLPNQISIDNVRFDTKVSEKDGKINSQGIFHFDAFHYGKEKYGPLNIDIVAEHLNPEGLNALKSALAQASLRKMSEEEVRHLLLQTARNEAASLFTDNPVIKVNQFELDTPSGQVYLAGQLSFKDLNKEDLNDIVRLINKTQAAFQFRVPQVLLENLVIGQAQSIFTVNPEDEAAGEAAIEDINETLRLMVDSSIKNLAAQDYLSIQNGVIHSKIELQQGEMKFNGKKFVMEMEEEYDYLENESSAQSASSETP